MNFSASEPYSPSLNSDSSSWSPSGTLQTSFLSWEWSLPIPSRFFQLLHSPNFSLIILEPSDGAEKCNACTDSPVSKEICWFSGLLSRSSGLAPAIEILQFGSQAAVFALKDVKFIHPSPQSSHSAPHTSFRSPQSLSSALYLQICPQLIPLPAYSASVSVDSSPTPYSGKSSASGTDQWFPWIFGGFPAPANQFFPLIMGLVGQHIIE